MKVYYISRNVKSNRRFRFRRISILATMLAMVCLMATACGEQTSSTSKRTDESHVETTATSTQLVKVYNQSQKSEGNSAPRVATAFDNITDPVPDAQAETIVQLTNQFRISKGLTALKTDDRLNKAAMERAKELAVTYSNTRPNGEDGKAIIKEYDKSAVPSGENMHMSYGKGYNGAQQVADSWTDSTAHQKKILDTDSEYIGVGVYYVEKDGYKYTYAVQLFCKSV